MPRVDRLSTEHTLQSFISGNVELDAWLRDAAATADRSGTARVYVWADDGREVMGYFAIVPHTVRREDVPSVIGRGSPTTSPGFLLARLALSETLHGHGRGGELLAIAIGQMLRAIEIGGGRVIVVDAIDRNAHDFYEHHGFRRVPGNASRLIMKASSAAASLGRDWP